MAKKEGLKAWYVDAQGVKTTNPLDFAGVRFEAPSLKRGVSVYVKDLNPESAAFAPCHGLKQKLGDAAALQAYETVDADGKKVTRYPTASEKFDAIVAMADQVTDPNGGWNARRGPTGGEMYAAVARAYPGDERFSTVESYRVWVAERAAERGVSVAAYEASAALHNEKIREALAAIRAERARGVDSDTVMADFEEV